MSSQSPEIGRFRKQKKTTWRASRGETKICHYILKMSYEGPLLQGLQGPIRDATKRVFNLKNQTTRIFQMFVFGWCWSYIFLLGKGERILELKETQKFPHTNVRSWHDLARICSSSEAPNCSFGSLVLGIWDHISHEKNTTHKLTTVSHGIPKQCVWLKNTSSVFGWLKPRLVS